MNAVIYARYSSENQREESIEGQLRECKAFAEKNNIKILDTYIDRALSARTDNRPDFQRMIKDSGKKLFDYVIVWKLDRFSRDRLDSAHYKVILKKNKVKVLSATEAIADDSTGILVESLLEGLAEYFSADLSEKVIRGLVENALKCKYNGSSVPLGFVIDDEQHYQIDPVSAPIVLEIYNRYDRGATIKEIVDIMNERGIKTPRSKRMRIDIITDILKNRKYIGEYKYREIVIPDGIPAIIPQDLFDRVQERRAKNKKAPARKKAEDDYLLTTKLFCGKDNVFMVGESGTSRNKSVHRYYRCVNTKKKRLCDKKPVKKDYIENLVIDAVMEMIQDDKIVGYIVDTVLSLQSQDSTSLPLLNRQLNETNKAIENMLNAIQQGVLTSSTKQRLDELETTKSELEISILQEQMIKPLLTKEQITFWIHRFRKTDITNLDQRQRLIDIFVNTIYHYDDHLAITFNYKDGTKIISLQEVEAAGLGSDIKGLAVPKMI